MILYPWLCLVLMAEINTMVTLVVEEIVLVVRKGSSLDEWAAESALHGHPGLLLLGLGLPNSFGMVPRQLLVLPEHKLVLGFAKTIRIFVIECWFGRLRHLHGHWILEQCGHRIGYSAGKIHQYSEGLL